MKIDIRSISGTCMCPRRLGCRQARSKDWFATGVLVSASTKSRRPRGRAPATSAAKSKTTASTLLLFDIDGTLVLTGGAGGRAMSRAFEDVFVVGNAFQGVPMAGRTDAWILSD